MRNRSTTVRRRPASAGRSLIARHRKCPLDSPALLHTWSVGFDEHGLLSIRAWLAAPWLFTVAVLGVTGFGGVLLGADWPVGLSAVVTGPAAAGTAVLAGA